MNMRRRLAIHMLAMASIGVGSARAQDFYLGEVLTVPYTFCPKGFAEMNGALLRIAQNTALFSLLGTTFGGDGKVTFALPTAKPIETANRRPLRQCIALQGIYPPRN